MERLQKLIAAAGITSRRGAEKLIEQGKVRLNGQLVTDLGRKADPEKDQIEVNGKPLPKVATITYVVNKPAGVVCSRRRQAHERLVTDLVPSQPSVYPIGRLDKETEGLILLTNDGKLAHQLTHPSFEHPKEYRVQAVWEKASPEQTPEWIINNLKKGRKLGDGVAKADQVDVKKNQDGSLLLTIVVHEGRHHLIRRLCASLDLQVKRLVRTRVGLLSLKGLGQGNYRILSPKEITSLTTP